MTRVEEQGRIAEQLRERATDLLGEAERGFDNRGEKKALAIELNKAADLLSIGSEPGLRDEDRERLLDVVGELLRIAGGVGDRLSTRLLGHATFLRRLADHQPPVDQPLLDLLYLIDRRIAKGVIDDEEIDAAREALGIPDQYLRTGKKASGEGA